MRQIADKFLKKKEELSNIPIISLEEWTIKKQYGNIYIYGSKKHYETKNDDFAIIGNAPFLVERETGRIVQFGTLYTTKEYIQQYEENTYEYADDSVIEPEDLDNY
ncbi:hypothetical protein [uncultured Tenacibaculum sp.]|uniref:hypothetical protein n=1 Tax=uncultured Tenacibaculum sp. TaxID=174713 RepID=UPI00262EA2C4|nr:hypothetical protein [uncultured Tenacibaculum sp.]